MIAGLLIGIGIVLPGVSGGVIAVILGVYDKITFLFPLFNIIQPQLSYFRECKFPWN